MGTMNENTKPVEIMTEVPKKLESSTRDALSALKNGMEKLAPKEKIDANELLGKLEKISTSKLNAKEAFNDMKIGMTYSQQQMTKTLIEKMAGSGSDVMKAFDGIGIDSVQPSPVIAVEKIEGTNNEVLDGIQKMTSSDTVKDMKSKAKGVVDDLKKVGSMAGLVVKMDALAD